MRAHGEARSALRALRESVSKAEEFAELCAAWDERIHSADWARNEAWRARDGMVMFLVDNREIVVRALRMLHLVENPSCALLDNLRCATGSSTHHVPRSVLNEILEAVK